MKRLRSLRPSPAMAVAIGALIFGMAGYAVAVPPGDAGNKNDQVAIQTTSGGPVETVNPSDGQAEITLADPTFTQKAAEVVLVSADADFSGGLPQDQANCDIFVGFVADTGGVDDHDLGFELVRLARRGDPVIKTADSQALPATTSDREITMSALVTEAIPPDEQGNPVPDEGQCDGEAYDVSLDVTLTSLRD